MTFFYMKCNTGLKLVKQVFYVLVIRNVLVTFLAFHGSIKGRKQGPFQASIYLLKVNNGNTRTTPIRCFGVFIVNFEQISYIFLVFPLRHRSVV